MSLLRLLTAGQSLVGLKQPASSYRLSDQAALPKFGSERNPLARIPVRTRTKGDPARMQSQGLITVTKATPAAESRTSGNELAERAAAREIKHTVASVVAVQSTTSQNVPGTGKAVTRSAGRFLNLGHALASASHVMKVARNFLPGKEQLGGKSKASGTSPRMLQGELLLENIKVVRNDLSDADWEIVARKVTKQAIAPVAQTVPAQIMAANPAVSRTSSRLCGLGKP